MAGTMLLGEESSGYSRDCMISGCLVASMGYRWQQPNAGSDVKLGVCVAQLLLWLN